jgi:hypothetical protein
LFDLPDGFADLRPGSLARTLPRLFLRIAGVLEPTVKNAAQQTPLGRCSIQAATPVAPRLPSSEVRKRMASSLR